MQKMREKVSEKFGGIKIYSYLCIRNQEMSENDSVITSNDRKEVWVSG